MSDLYQTGALDGALTMLLPDVDVRVFSDHKTVTVYLWYEDDRMQRIDRSREALRDAGFEITARSIAKAA